MNEKAHSIAVPMGLTLGQSLTALFVASVVWIAAYSQLTPFADAIVAGLGLERGAHLTEAVHFFVYDTPKVLIGVVFLMGVVQTFFRSSARALPVSGSGWATPWPPVWASSRRFVPARRCRCSSAFWPPACHWG